MGSWCRDSRALLLLTLAVDLLWWWFQRLRGNTMLLTTSNQVSMKSSLRAPMTVLGCSSTQAPPSLPSGTNTNVARLLIHSLVSWSVPCPVAPPRDRTFLHRAWPEWNKHSSRLAYRNSSQTTTRTVFSKSVCTLGGASRRPRENYRFKVCLNSFVKMYHYRQCSWNERIISSVGETNVGESCCTGCDIQLGAKGRPPPVRH